MKALILAGGFATRMGEFGKDLPKPLLPVAGRPVIEHILEKIEPLAVIGDVFISTNKKFEGHFSEWMSRLSTRLNTKLVVEPIMEEGQKLGSVGALNFFIKENKIDEDLLIINGDNLFKSGLNECLEFYGKRGTFVFGVYDTGSIDEARKLGVVICDQNRRVIDFEEKPKNPKGTQVSTGIYIMPRSVIPMIRNYIKEGNSADRMGDFLAWLMKRHEMHAFAISDKWFDIGTPDTYKKAKEEFGS